LPEQTVRTDEAAQYHDFPGESALEERELALKFSEDSEVARRFVVGNCNFKLALVMIGKESRVYQILSWESMLSNNAHFDNAIYEDAAKQ